MISVCFLPKKKHIFQCKAPSENVFSLPKTELLDYGYTEVNCYVSLGYLVPGTASLSLPGVEILTFQLLCTVCHPANLRSLLFLYFYSVSSMAETKQTVMC